MPIDILMPALSPTMTEGKLAKWLKQEGDEAALRGVRGDRLAVEGDDDRLVALEVEPEDAGIRGINEPQADALAGLHPEALRHMAVDGDRVADPAVVAQVMAVAEILTYLGRAGEAPVVEHPGEVPVDAGRFRLLDDERPIEAAADLLEAALVGVVDRKSTRLNSSH